MMTNPEVARDQRSPRAERMWVEVCAMPDHGVPRGPRTNAPAFIPELGPGDVIEFRWRHVAQVHVRAGAPRHSGEHP